MLASFVTQSPRGSLNVAFLLGHLQIIEEQLAFPSGTATAQLISVLHKLPPPDTSVRRRRGYRELSTERDDEAESPLIHAEPLLEAPELAEREVVQHEGWHDLVWSFLVSSAMTVSVLHGLGP